MRTVSGWHAADQQRAIATSEDEAAHPAKLPSGPVTSPDPLPALLAPFRDRPDAAAVITDFDGTLSPIVDDPDAARPAARRRRRCCTALAGRYGRVVGRLGPPGSLPGRAPRAGRLPAPRRLRALRPRVDRRRGGRRAPRRRRRGAPSSTTAVGAARAEAPGRRHRRAQGPGRSRCTSASRPKRGGLGRGLGRRARGRRPGLVVHPARKSYELRPPVAVDKGTVVADLVDGMDAACFIGDDLGDLPAFDALDAARRRDGLHGPAGRASAAPRRRPSCSSAPTSWSTARRASWTFWPVWPNPWPDFSQSRGLAAGACEKSVGVAATERRRPGAGRAASRWGCGGRRRARRTGGPAGPLVGLHRRAPRRGPRRAGDVERVDLERAVGRAPPTRRPRG